VASCRGNGRRGANPWLSNIACGYVISSWLTEMEEGEPPDGVLYDPAEGGSPRKRCTTRSQWSGRQLRKPATLRGAGLADILPAPLAGQARSGRR